LYDIILLESFTCFLMLYEHYCDLVIWCDCYVTVLLWCHLTLTLVLRIENQKNKSKEKENRKDIRKNLSSNFTILTLMESSIWKSRWADEYVCEKKSQNIDQSKNIEEKSLKEASLLVLKL